MRNGFISNSGDVVQVRTTFSCGGPPVPPLYRSWTALSQRRKFTKCYLLASGNSKCEGSSLTFGQSVMPSSRPAPQRPCLSERALAHSYGQYLNLASLSLKLSVDPAQISFCAHFVAFKGQFPSPSSSFERDFPHPTRHFLDLAMNSVSSS